MNRILLLISCMALGVNINAQSIDLRLLEKINSPGNHGDGYWRFVTNSAVYIDIAAPVTLIATGFINNDGQLKLKGYETSASLIVAEGASYILKELVKRERPFYRYPGLITPKVTETGYSFPSGHASLAFATATSLSIANPKWYVIAPSFLYASTVGYSRLYLGVHYPSDVLGGAIVGAGSAFLTFKAQQWLGRKRTKKFIE